jgi:hypothetical protein
MALYSHGRRAGEFITVMTMRRLRTGTAPKIISGMGCIKIVGAVTLSLCSGAKDSLACSR